MLQLTKRWLVVSPGLVLIALLLSSCGSEDSLVAPERLVLSETEETADAALTLNTDAPPCDEWDPGAHVCTLHPSGDPSGVSDADRIEAGMYFVSGFDGDATLLLSDGKPQTRDIYTTSRNIVVVGFTGVLCGEGADQTFLRAVKVSKQVGFQPGVSPLWTPRSATGDALMATMLQLDNAVGDITICDFTIQSKIKKITDPRTGFYGSANATHMETMIELIGVGSADEDQHVTIDGMVFAGNKHFGVHYALHHMPWYRPLSGPPSTWPPPSKTQSSLTVTNSRFENFLWWGIGAMDIAGVGGITVNDVDIDNVGEGLFFSRLDTPVSISDVDISVRDVGHFWTRAITLIASDVGGTGIPTITGTHIAGHPDAYAIHLLRGTTGALIEGNTFTTPSRASVAMTNGAAGNTVGLNTWPEGRTVCTDVYDPNEMNTVVGTDACPAG